MVRNSILDKAAFEKRHDRSERVIHRETQRRSIPGRGNSKYKGPEVGLCWPSGETIKRPVWLAIGYKTYSFYSKMESYCQRSYMI